MPARCRGHRSGGPWVGLIRSLITAGRDVTRSSVYVTVVAAFDHEAAQQWLDALYGNDAVRLFTVLTRLDP